MGDQLQRRTQQKEQKHLQEGRKEAETEQEIDGTLVSVIFVFYKLIIFLCWMSLAQKWATKCNATQKSITTQILLLCCKNKTSMADHLQHL